jgi:hypothetical protein
MEQGRKEAARAKLTATVRRAPEVAPLRSRLAESPSSALLLAGHGDLRAKPGAVAKIQSKSAGGLHYAFIPSGNFLTTCSATFGNGFKTLRPHQAKAATDPLAVIRDSRGKGCARGLLELRFSERPGVVPFQVRAYELEQQIRLPMCL